MFTGIVQERGRVVHRQRAKGLVRLTVEAPRTAATVQRLESVAVNGVCLSVVAVGASALTFEVILETQQLTTIGQLQVGDPVNLEPSLSVSDRLGGHLLFGHIDAVGTVVSRRQRPGELVLEIRVAEALRKFLVPKGAVAVDGVSLTVGRVLTARTFTVHLIPETLRQTTLRDRLVDHRVNVEIDYFAKLVWQYVRGRSARG